MDTILELKTKQQLYKIIVKNKKPDVLAINLYWDTIHSNYHLSGINKSSSGGLYISYTQIANLYQVSKETIRKKFILLEHLGLINRNFERKRTKLVKSFNKLVIYMWRETPYFLNAHGISRKKIKNLKPYTNHKYIQLRYDVTFQKEVKREDLDDRQKKVQNNLISTRGIQEKVDTNKSKEISRSIDRSKESYNPKSSLRDNNVLEKKEFLIEKKEKKSHHKRSLANKTLREFYPLDNLDCENLRNRSGREFNLKAMNQILLDISRKLANRWFKTKEIFMKYMAKLLSYEKRQESNANRYDFRIRNNISVEEKELMNQEEYLSKIEANTERSPESDFRRKIVQILPERQSLKLLKSLKSIKVNNGIFEISLSESLNFTAFQMKEVLKQAQFSYDKMNLSGKKVVSIHSIKINEYQKNHSKESQSVQTSQIWLRVKEKLLKIYGQYVYRNWFENLKIIEDESKYQIIIVTPTKLSKDWIFQNYYENLEEFVHSESYKLVIN